MTVERLYTLRELAEATGFTTQHLRDLIADGQLAAVRPTPTARIRVSASAWRAWQDGHVVATKPAGIVVPLTPPKSAPATRRQSVSVDDLLPTGFNKPFPRSA